MCWCKWHPFQTRVTPAELRNAGSQLLDLTLRPRPSRPLVAGSFTGSRPTLLAARAIDGRRGRALVAPGLAGAAPLLRWLAARAWAWLTKLRNASPNGEGGEAVLKIGSLLVALSILVYLGALLFRSWGNFSTPGLYVEDATLHFNAYYGGADRLTSVLDRPHGYYSLFGNLVAWVVAKMDVRVQPASYLVVATACAVTTSTCLLFSGLFKTRGVIFVAPTVLGLVGMNHIYYYVTLTYQIYVVVVLLICLMFFRPPKSTVGFVVLFLVYMLLIWSGPYSVLALPTALLFILFFPGRRRNALMAGVILCTLAYSLTSRGLIRLENLLDPSILWHMLGALINKVIFLGSIEYHHAKASVVVVALAGVLYLLRRDFYFHRYSLILASVVLLSLTPLFLSAKYDQYPNPLPCHVFIAQFFWLVWLLLAADRLVLTKWPRAWFAATVVAGFLALVYVDNNSVPTRGAKRPMKGLARYLKAIKSVEQLELEKRNEFVVLRYRRAHFSPRVEVGSREGGARWLPLTDPRLKAVRKFVEKRSRLRRKGRPKNTK